MKNRPPTVDEVCQHLRDNWDKLQRLGDWTLVSTMQVSESAVFAMMEEQVRYSLAVKAVQSGLTLLTKVEVDWIVAPRVRHSLAPDLGAAIPFDPATGTVPEEWKTTGYLKCTAQAWALPIAEAVAG